MSGGQNRSGNVQQKQIIPSDKIKEIIQSDKPKELVEYAEKYADILHDILTTSQIRTFFSEVKLIEGIVRDNKNLTPDVIRRLYLLKPKLAYQAKRHGKGVIILEEALKPAIDCAVESKENFQRFMDFFEAILAYHKAKGGN